MRLYRLHFKRYFLESHTKKPFFFAIPFTLFFFFHPGTIFLAVHFVNLLKKGIFHSVHKPQEAC